MLRKRVPWGVGDGKRLVAPLFKDSVCSRIDSKLFRRLSPPEVVEFGSRLTCSEIRVGPSSLRYRICMPDIETLRMALIGYQLERQKLQQKIEEIEHQLSGRKVTAGDGPTPARPRRKMSAAAKARIRAAQVKRWKEYRAKQARTTTAKKAAPKRKLSPARRAALLANLKKAREAKRAKAQTAA